MNQLNNLADFLTVFGNQAQKALDFLSDESNQRKLNRYLASQNESKETNTLAQIDHTDKETKIRIAIDDGLFLTKEEWEAGQYRRGSVIGIAVFTPCVQFILGLHQWKGRWSEDIDHCITGEHNEAQALQVLSGFKATKEFAEAQEGEGSTVAKLCWNYGYKGRQWYCPSLLELSAIYVNWEEINKLMKPVGGQPLIRDGYWSTVEYDNKDAWYISFFSGRIISSPKLTTNMILPVTAI